MIEKNSSSSLDSSFYDLVDIQSKLFPKAYASLEVESFNIITFHAIDIPWISMKEQLNSLTYISSITFETQENCFWNIVKNIY